MKHEITMRSDEEMTAASVFEMFTRKCRVKNLAEETIKGYRAKINSFLKFYGGDSPVSGITSDTVDDYILWMRENGTMNDITINTQLRHLRAFLYYAMYCGYMDRFKVRLTKAEKKIKETYTEAELQRLLKRPDVNKCSFSEYKIWAFENYLLGTGNRIGTALNVRIGDLDFENMLIHLRKTKNRKQQIIPMSRTLGDVLGEYLLYRKGNPEDYLFCNSYGEKPDKRAYQGMVRGYNLKRNVNKTSCHLFRHTFAKICIKNGMDAFWLQRLLGHSSLAVTKEYIELFATDLQADFDRFNPLDSVAKKSQRIRLEK